MYTLCIVSENRPSKATVDFPTCDSTQATSLSPNGPDNHIYPAPYLPFRRISLPSAPNLNHRLSVVSTASFDSMPEVPHVPILVSTPKGVARGLRNRPSSVEAARRNQRRRETKSVVVDEQREAKRRKVINELHETERTYVDALELIYSVRISFSRVCDLLILPFSIFLHQSLLLWIPLINFSTELNLHPYSQISLTSGTFIAHFTLP